MYVIRENVLHYLNDSPEILDAKNSRGCLKRVASNFFAKYYFAWLKSH